MKKNMLNGSSSVGGTCNDGFKLRHIYTFYCFNTKLTYGLHNSTKCFSHYQHNIIFFSGKLICVKYDDPKIKETYIFGDGWKSVLY